MLAELGLPDHSLMQMLAVDRNEEPVTMNG